MSNLFDGILAEMDRVRELVREYEQLPGGAGMFGAAIMKQAIERGKRAIASGDVVEALQAYNDLQECTG